jgi:hypothetical protein
MQFPCGQHSGLKGTFTRCKLVRESQVPGMREQMLLASRIMEVTSLFIVKPVELIVIYMKRLLVHPRHLLARANLHRVNATLFRGSKIAARL